MSFSFHHTGVTTLTDSAQPFFPQSHTTMPAPNSKMKTDWNRRVPKKTWQPWESEGIITEPYIHIEKREDKGWTKQERGWNQLRGASIWNSELKPFAQVPICHSQDSLWVPTASQERCIWNSFHCVGREACALIDHLRRENFNKELSKWGWPVGMSMEDYLDLLGIIP